MRCLRNLTTVGVILMAVSIAVAQAGASGGSSAQPKLTNSASSIDALLDAFQKALDARDEQALHRLRVTEQEYCDIIIPGTVKPGEAPRTVAPTPSAFWWSMINQKSEDTARMFLERFGGHKTKRIAVTFSKGTREFAWYKAHGDVRLTLEDEQGRQRELHTGAIAEIDGQFKFIGFNTNN